jgi:hypothetical protein
MTLSTTTVRTTFAGSGSTGPFSFPFKITAASDLDVYKTTAVGGISLLSYPSAYSVTGVGDAAGGSLTLTTALATGETLAIVRDVPTTQPTSLRTQGTFLPESHEDALDRLTMIDQQQDDALGSAVRLAPSLDPATHTVTLTPETGKALVWQSPTMLGNSTIDNTSIAVPGEGRTVPTATAYLMNNAVYNVLDYGAKGDGATDDSAAIQRAINAAHAFNGGSAVSGGGTVVFPAATFICLSALTLYGNVSLRGAGMFQTMVWFTNHTDGIVLDLPTFPTQAMSITDMRVWGSQDATTIGIRASNTTQFHLRRVFVGAFGINLRNRDFIFTRLSGCQFGAYYGTKASVVFGDVTTAPTFSTTLFLTDTYISCGNTVGGCALQIDRGSTVVIRGGALESGGVGIRLGATNSGADGFYTTNVHIIDVDMENCVGKYMEIGTAWTAPGYAVLGVELQNIFASLSGSVNTPIGISVANTYDFRVDGISLALSSPGTAAFDFVGTNNALVHIKPPTVADLNGGAYIRSNGVTLSHSQWDLVQFLPGENHRIVVDQAALGAQSGFAGLNSLRSDTIANNGELTLPNFVGRVVFIFTGAGWTLEYELQGGNNTTKLISDPNSVSSAVYNTAGKINIAWNGTSNYKIQNKSGSSLAVRILLIGSA